MSKKIFGISLIIITIISIIIFLDMNIDYEEGINVYHMKGEGFNASINLGMIQVSPELNDNIVFLCGAFLLCIFCLYCFVLGGGFKLLKNSNKEEEDEN